MALPGLERTVALASPSQLQLPCLCLGLQCAALDVPACPSSQPCFAVEEESGAFTVARSSNDPVDSTCFIRSTSLLLGWFQVDFFGSLRTVVRINAIV